MRIDLNADIGEGCGDDAGLLACVSSASIACGGHAGDEASMREALRLCAASGVAAGAHPSFVDREHFGRRALPCTPAEVRAMVGEQIARLQALAAQQGLRLRHVKPHGALYNQAADDPRLAEAIVAAVRDQDPQLAVYGLAGSALPAAARRAGLRGVDEAFADRGYDANLRLLARGSPGALLSDADAASAQLLELVLRGGVHSSAGWRVLSAQSVCLHGDTPGALPMAQALRAALAGAGVAVQAP